MQDRILKKNELLYPNCIKFFYVEKLYGIQFIQSIRGTL